MAAKKRKYGGQNPPNQAQGGKRNFGPKGPPPKSVRDTSSEAIATVHKIENILSTTNGEKVTEKQEAKLIEFTRDLVGQMNAQLQELHSLKVTVEELKCENASLVSKMAGMHSTADCPQQQSAEQAATPVSGDGCLAGNAALCNNIAAAIKALTDEKDSLAAYKAKAERALDVNKALLVDRARALDASNDTIQRLAAENAARMRDIVGLQNEVERFRRQHAILGTQLEESEHVGNERACLMHAQGQKRDTEMRSLNLKLRECLSALGARPPTPAAPAAMCGWADVEAQVSQILEIAKGLRVEEVEKDAEDIVTAATTTQGETPPEVPKIANLCSDVAARSRGVNTTNRKLTRAHKGLAEKQQKCTSIHNQLDATSKAKRWASKEVDEAEKRITQLREVLHEKKKALAEAQMRVAEAHKRPAEDQASRAAMPKKVTFAQSAKLPAPSTPQLKHEPNEEYDGDYIYHQLQQQRDLVVSQGKRC